MTKAASRNATRRRLNSLREAWNVFICLLDEPCTDWILRPLRRDQQWICWSKLKPRLDRLQRDANAGCPYTLEWIEKHLEETGYVLARGEWYDASYRRAQAASMEAAKRADERRKAFERERDAYVAKCRGELVQDS